MWLINEDKLDDYVFKSASERMDLSVEYMFGWNDAIHHIKVNAPTVDAEPVRHGKWKQWDSYGFEDTYECTECGEAFVLIEGTPITNEYKYCPSCGARMDGVEE